MRVKISTSPPLPPLKAWFPLHGTESTRKTICSLKTLLCASLPVLRNTPSSSLRLSVEGYELLDGSELTIIRDGDLICIDTLDSEVAAPLASQVHVDSGTATSHKRKRHVSMSSLSDTDSDESPWPPQNKPKIVRTGQEPGTLLKQKRRMSMSGSSSSESTTSESESDTSDEDSTSESDKSTTKAEPVKIQAREPYVAQPSAIFVPPGYGKPQTRSRNLRRRLKRMHERDPAGQSDQSEGPLSGANTAETLTTPATDPMSGLMSLSLRNKNKAKNFRALIGKPLPPKIIFGEGDDEMATTEVTCKSSTRVMPRLIPPSSRSSLPPNLFVTSVDVEAGLRKHRTSEEEVTEVVDTRLESLAEERWETLEKVTSEEQVGPGTVVGYKALGIDPIKCTPEFLLTVGRVQSCDVRSVVLRPLRERGNISFSGPVADDAEMAEQEHTWAEILDGDWRVVE